MTAGARTRAIAGVIGLEPDRQVVMAVARVLAPAVVATAAPDGRVGHWPSPAVGTPPQPQQPEGAARGAAVALALVGPDAAAAERHRHRERSGQQPAAGGLPWLGPHPEAIKRSLVQRFHGLALLSPDALFRAKA